MFCVYYLLLQRLIKHSLGRLLRTVKVLWKSLFEWGFVLAVENEGNKDYSTLCTWHKDLKARTCETKKCGSSMEIAIEKQWLFNVLSRFANNCSLCHLSCRDRKEIQLRNSAAKHDLQTEQCTVANITLISILPQQLPSILNKQFNFGFVSPNKFFRYFLAYFLRFLANLSRFVLCLRFTMRCKASLPDNLDFIRILETLDL